MDDDDLSAAVELARELRYRGKYAMAAGHLENFLKTHSHSLALVAELGDTLLIQGNYARCFGLLEAYVPNPTTELDPITFDGLGRVEIAYNSFLTGEYAKVVDEATVRIETYYCAFWQLAAACGAIDDTQIQGQVLPRLKEKFPLLLEKGAFREVLSIARTCNACDKGTSGPDLLRGLSGYERTPKIYRAHAKLLLARDLTIEQREEQTTLYNAARELYEDEGHAHGALDVEIALLCQERSSLENEKFSEKAISILKQYENLEYFLGLASGVRLLFNNAGKFSDVSAEVAYFNQLEALYQARGAKLLWLVAQSILLATLGRRGGDSGKTARSGEALWNELVDSDCAAIRGQTALSLAGTYHGLKDQDKIALWTERAQKDLDGSKLVVLPSFDKRYDLSKSGDIKRCLDELEISMNPRKNSYSAKLAVETFDALVQDILQYLDRGIYAFATVVQVIDTWEQHINRCTKGRNATIQMAKAHGARSFLLIGQVSARQDIDYELVALEHLQKALDLYNEAEDYGLALLILQQMGLVDISIAQKAERINAEHAQLAYQRARTYYQTATDSASQLGLSFIEIETAYWIAFCEYRLWIHGKFDADEVLQSVLRAERLSDRRRQEVSILGGLAAAEAKRRLSSNKHVRNTYKFAVQISLTQGDVPNAWHWVQKSKARSLSDALGLGIIIPQHLTEQISRNPEAQNWLVGEAAILETLQKTKEIERYLVRQKLEKHQAIMRSETILADLLDLREGVPLRLDDLSPSELNKKSMFNSTTVFVDWAIFDNDILMLVVKHGEQPLSFKISLTYQSVRLWISEYLESGTEPNNVHYREQRLSGLREDDYDNEGPLRALDALIAPLYSLTNPDDLVVLCPTGILHPLPLHALQFGPPDDKQILIERNLVVYCASLTTFVQCCRRAEARPVAESTRRFLAVYEASSAQSDDKFTSLKEIDVERRQIYDLNKRMADSMRGRSLVGEEVTPTSVRVSVEGADWVQFLGHHHYSHENVVEQALVVCKDAESDSDCSFGMVKVKDMFDFHVRASHITLLACATAAQDFQLGDEPLGLISALLTAGVTSAVGTLWPVQVATARSFAERFHYYLSNTPEKFQPGGEWLNLAYAMREALLDLRNDFENFRQPYHWAAFVLHGSWFYNGTLR